MNEFGLGISVFVPPEIRSRKRVGGGDQGRVRARLKGRQVSALSCVYCRNSNKQMPVKDL